MAHCAHLLIPPRVGPGIEARAVRVERDVAAQAVPLGMTRHTALEVLSRRLRVASDERRVPVVVPRADGTARYEPGLLVAALTELAHVVA
ncbi:MAG: hypothetical protein OEO77_15205, partial [Acidimicrobiia bacterium]|nr:hypothetical protein [Acidimicrobiia bacterium]